MANSAEWKPVPLAASVDQRYADTSIDGLMTNGYLEKDEAGAMWTRRRAGLTKNLTLSQTGGGRGTAILYPAGTTIGTIVSFGNPLTSGNTIYVDGVLAYTYTATSSFAWLDQSTVATNTQIYASNGIEGAYKNGVAAFAKITDANYPAVTINGSAYLNGYLYVLDPNGSIWGTPNQNNFAVWSSTNVVNAWGTVGAAVAIRRYLNEVLVFKTFTVEVFYDAGNNGIGSPLLPVQQINIKWGCVTPQTIVEIDDDMFWVGNSESGLNAVIRMNQFNAQPISTPQINRLLSINGQTGSSLGVQAAFSCNMGGNKFYCLSYVTNQNNITNTIVLGYNLGTGEWSVLMSTQLIPSGIFIQPPPYPLASTNNPASDVQQILFNNGEVYSVDDSVTVDSYSPTGHYPIQMRLRTDNFEAGTSLRKMVSGLRIKADQKSASALRIRWSDDDYQTWSAWRSIDLTKPVPSLPGLQGTFSKRAYELEYAGSDPIRFSRLELLIALGDI